MEHQEDIGYEIGEWYMVQIGFDDIFIPAKFIGIRKPCSLPENLFHRFPHPGEAVFENVKIWNGCGFKGSEWLDKSDYSTIGEYTSYKPTFRHVKENELWAVQAIEEFQRMIAGRQKSFTISLPNGFQFEGKIKAPKEKGDLPGEYYAKAINPKTGEEKEGRFEYDGKSESVHFFLLSRLPGWHIVMLKQQKIFDTPRLKK